ncbi:MULTISPECIES: CaiB/BaiF CoA transferase family protein [Mycobacterium]|uniref:CoA transferase n=1 Tax=Mycobacterium intracellulare TaxID=1767 RepID=A0A7R7MU12_MYCIT|nr:MULTISPECIES: CoA transferase [Mycobacterium]AFC47770.1 caib/baif family protein [Mycobacterium intracellulare MOTT-02]ASW85035.1 CoA transferase [Mycobacterium intracellulare]ASW94545.1 CoA transferase [Mycobacterium intracellulare]MCA2231303.1 CoA transferase [Mycobacterium intracellulare]MCA2249342.1 CoA transferase [Mycobacterium intracellulare]
MPEVGTASGGPLAGLVVVDLSTTLPGAQATQFLADCGAEVIMVEPLDGSPLRELAGWPALLRGKLSVTLDLHDEADLERLRALLRRADVMVNTMRPTTAERIGLTPDALSEAYPRLVVATITGWGSTGPFRDYKGWEALVMAKTGVMHEKRGLTTRPGPAYTTFAYASWGAAHAAVQGVLAALLERESSGRGQTVETNLVTGMGSMDPYNWFYEMVLERYPGAFEPMDAAYDDQGRPQAYLIYALLVCPTKDGRWLQFAQVSPKLIGAWLTELDLLGDLADPKWQGFPMLPTPELRTEWWDMMIERVGARTLAEWQRAMTENLDLSGELFRTPEESLDHPQTAHEGRAATVIDPDLGPVRQPSTLIHADGKPLTPLRPAPRVGEHNDSVTFEQLGQVRRAALPARHADHDAPPLTGVTVLEFGSMFAGPYGATLLADLGARVIKVEPLEGDNIRNLVAFPEAGGAKVLQGKESVAIDFTKPEGLELVYELAKRSDIVLQCFRGKAAERAKIDEASLRAVNPDLAFVTTSGYGVDGPFAHRAAYAPSVGAASGLALVDSHDTGEPATDLDDLHRRAVKLHAGGAVPAVQSDGIAAHGVGSALLVALYAKRMGRPMSNVVTTMLATAQQAMIAYSASYASRPAEAAADEQFFGMNALYRMYRAADGYVFLAAPLPREWPALTKAMSPYVDLHADERFTDAESRAAHDDELISVLTTVFANKTKLEWEHELSAQDVGCVEVVEANSELVLQSDPYYEAGYAVDAHSPIFEEHRRLAPLCRFSRSRTRADAGCTIGQHTEAVLREIGLDEAAIADLRAREIVGGG